MPYEVGRASVLIPNSPPARERHVAHANCRHGSTKFTAIADDHKAYYPGAKPLSIRITGETNTGLLLGAQLVGARGAEIAKRVDTYASTHTPRHSTTA